ncbi:hypothetical protein CEXT_143601 [Caerostris extrusa]|uniref:Uncharacterized protein n=1 Tax=Caerostris extrusa TaxID=172846 RepID=A0AAV4NEJ4_CAEEX|nr:hypothetical protein CEXT_143601 [Caerostris extrusa]
MPPLPIPEEHKIMSPFHFFGDGTDLSPEYHMVTPPVRKKRVYESPLSPSQTNNSLAEATNVNLPGKHPSETVIDGNLVAKKLRSLRKLRITHCTPGNEITIATQIANQKKEMQAICVNLNVLYGKLPSNQKGSR